MTVWSDFPCRQVNVPMGISDTNVPSGRNVEVIAEIHGPFAIHAAIHVAFHTDADEIEWAMVPKDESWIVAHELTGYAVAHVDSLARGRWLAETLLALGFDWSFADPLAPRRWTPEQQGQIKTAIDEARALLPQMLP